jgi:hypothetical protein
MPPPAVATSQPSTSASTPAPTQTPLATPTPIVTATGEVAATETPSPTPTATLEPTATTAATAVATVEADPQGVRVVAVHVTFGHRPVHGQRRHESTTLLRLLVPVRAFATPLLIRVELAPFASADVLSGTVGQRNDVGIGPVYDLIAVSAATGAPVHQFARNHPLLIQMTYDPADLDGVAPTTLTIAFFDTASRTWRALPTTLDTYNHTLTATTTHLTLFQVRGTARTQAQLKAAQATQAAIAAAGPPRVAVVPVVPVALDGVPLIVTVPAGRQRAPLSIQITGAPHAEVQVTFTTGGTSVVQFLPLDAHGYATTAYVPGVPLKNPQQLLVTVAVARGTARRTASQTVLLLPSESTGPLPLGAPVLSATLSSAHTRAGAPSPRLTVHTAPGATVMVMVLLAEQTSTPVGTIVGKADARGGIAVRLPRIPRPLVIARTTRTHPTLALQAVITARLDTASSRQTLQFSVSR